MFWRLRGKQSLSQAICNLKNGVIEMDRVETSVDAGEHFAQSAPNTTAAVDQYYVGQNDTRPWGRWEVIDTDSPKNSFCDKHITVLPGKALSLQSHDHRNELWRVVKGQLEVVLNDQRLTLGEGEEVYLNVGDIHAMANLTDTPVVVFEHQGGAPKCVEADIKRYFDSNGRPTELGDNPIVLASLEIYKQVAADAAAVEARVAQAAALDANAPGARRG